MTVGKENEDTIELREELNQRFREIHNQYYALLRLTAGRKGIPYDEIDDMLQETFLSYYQHYSLDLEDEHIRYILLKILKNRCIDYWRAWGSKDITCLEPQEMENLEGDRQEQRENDSLSLILRQEQIEEVMEAVHSMKEEWAVVFKMNIMEGRSMREVSQILGISEALCRMRIMRGRRYLRKQFDENGRIRVAG